MHACATLHACVRNLACAAPRRGRHRARMHACTHAPTHQEGAYGLKRLLPAIPKLKVLVLQDPGDVVQHRLVALPPKQRRHLPADIWCHGLWAVGCHHSEVPGP